jgi:hypothetical protein
MKKIFFCTFCAALIITLSPCLSAQKVLQLDKELISNSQPMEVKRKGISVIGRYQFGPYRIVSAKAGWTTTKSKSHLFKPETEFESKSKSSFILVANNEDSIQVNISTNTKVSETESGDMLILNQSDQNFIAIIKALNDSIPWKLIYIVKEGANLGENYVAEGILSDGFSEIRVKPLAQSPDGSYSIINRLFGFDFSIGSNSIAAVQTGPQRIVWLHQALDEHTRFFLAAASAALIVYTDSTMNSQ